MGIWAEIDAKLMHGEELEEGEKILLSNWLRDAGKEGSEYLRRTYENSIKTIIEVERMIQSKKDWEKLADELANRIASDMGDYYDYKAFGVLGDYVYEVAYKRLLEFFEKEFFKRKYGVCRVCGAELIESERKREICELCWQDMLLEHP